MEGRQHEHPSFSVVILSANAANLVPCVRSVLANEPDLPLDRLIVVDDGARAEAEPLLPPVRWVTGVEPFIFARNANLGIRVAEGDVILLNDDARLETPNGFTDLVERARCQERLGVCSAGIHGMVGNPRQYATGRAELRIEPVTLAFVCVYLPRRVLDTLGELDERFSGYGFDDNDYCARVLAAGLELTVWDGCVVEHGVLPPTFRSRSDWRTLSQQNERLYVDKWRTIARSTDRPVDLAYVARNRLELTRETFSTLWRNTNWTLVRSLTIYDLGSEDGTDTWLEGEAGRMPVPTSVVRTTRGSVELMLAGAVRPGEAGRATPPDTWHPPRAAGQSADGGIRHPPGVASQADDAAPQCLPGEAPILARVDNDTMVAPGWLRRLLADQRTHAKSPWERGHPGRSGLSQRNGQDGCAPSELALPDAQPASFQFESFLLDRLPYEPWATLADSYAEWGWQDVRPRYDPDLTLWHWRWPDLIPAVAPTRPRFVGAMRIKNEARWLAEVLTRALALCSQVFVLDDHSTDDTVRICQSFGDRVTVFPSPFEGLDEARDKNYLLERVIEAKPDWVLWIDGDEVLELSGPEQLQQAVSEVSSEVASFRLRIAYLWDDDRKVRVDGLWGTFMRPSLFRLQGQPLRDLRFRTTSAGGNFHCGNVPVGLLGEVRRLEVRLKHYGYLERAHRQAKYVWYNQRDPDNEREDRYRHLAEIPGARHAPGPAVYTTWTE